MSPSERPTTVAAAVLFDGWHVRANCVVDLADGRVVDVRELGDEEFSRAREEADLAARAVVPGLVDAHVHITGYREGLPAGNPYEPAKHFLRLCLLNGVTSLRDTGNSIEALEYLKEWAGRYDGPRIVGCGPLLDTPPLTWAFSRLVRDAESAADQVGRLAHEGVDFIKAYRNVEPAVLRAIVNAAREHDLDVAVDLARTGIDEACTLGVRSVEHVVTLNGAGVLDGSCACREGAVEHVKAWADVDVHGDRAKRLRALFVEHDVALVPTFLVTRRWTFFDEMTAEPHNREMAAVMPYHRHFEHMRGAMGARIGRRVAGKYMPIAPLSKADVVQATRGIDHMRELVSLMHGDGVAIVAGTDAPNPSVVPGFGLHTELGELVRAGLDPLDALRAATGQAGKLLRRPDIGVIAEGSHADLVLLDRDPTTDISATAAIAAVVRGGTVVDRARLERLVKEGIG